MAHSTTSILQQNNRFLFSFKSKASNPHFSFHSLHLNKPLLPLSSSLSSFPSSRFVTRASTAPVEYAPPTPNFNFYREISRLKNLRSKLSVAKTVEDKVAVVDRDPRVKRFFEGLSRSRSRSGFATVLASLNADSYGLFLVKCLVAAGQEHVLGLEFESARSDIKSALYALVEMIEKLGNGSERSGSNTGFGLKSEEVGDFEKLLKTLGEIEQFYDCIGGIIGMRISLAYTS